jgi:hypothetical protein
MNHVATNKPIFDNAEEYWKYTVEFHNTVNIRTKKLEWSYEEAETSLLIKLQEFNLDLESVNRAFLQEFWNVLIYTCFTFSITPDATTDAEQTRFKNFITSSCYTLPFWSFVTSGGKTVQELLLEFINTPQNINLTTRDSAIETIANFHNVICGDFDVSPVTREEFKNKFMELFQSDNYSKLVRAHQIREEDHVKMLALQTELNEIKTTGTVTILKPENPWKTSTTILTIVCTILACFIVLDNLKQRKNRIPRLTNEASKR